VLLHRTSGPVPAERGIASRGTTPRGAPSIGTASGEIDSRGGESGGIETLSGGPTSGSAVFTGNLPCADCTTVRHQLELFGDESYFLRRTFVRRGRTTVVDDIGTWRLSRDRGTLTLAGSEGPPVTIAIGKPNTLHVLAESGKPVPPRSNALTLTSRAQPIEPRLRMRGMYRYTADAGRFTECRTHQSWPVAQEGANAALEAAYSRTRRTRGEPLLVELVGRVASRPDAEGRGNQRTLVVEKFDAVRRGASCDSPASGDVSLGASEPSSTSSSMSSEVLENTDWTLTRVGDKTVAAGAGQRAPHFVLHAATRRVSGSAGCNRLLGRYEAEDTSLTFSDVASSRMACASGMDVERQFLAALRVTRTARITQRHLELFDGGGKFLARLEARRAD
jgi:copper homeostasis protein (lipoprotein)